MQERIHGLWQEAAHKSRQIKALEQALQSKESVENFNQLLARFNVFSEVETIKALEDHYMPKIANLDAHLSAYDNNLIETRECV